MSKSIVPSIIKSYKGKNIRVNPIDRYTCLTDMAKASGKLVKDWVRLDSTTAYLEALSSMAGIPLTNLLVVGKGNQPTWAHPKVAIKFAAWCSPQFEVQVTSWIDELLTTGSVSIAPKVAAKSIPNYLPARTKCMDLLKEHGARSYAYRMVEKYNNELNGIDKGSRHAVTQEEAIGLVMNYQSATIELLERKRGFSTHEAHLANTAKKAMRHEKYVQFGEGSVPESLKPRKEQKLIG